MARRASRRGRRRRKSSRRSSYRSHRRSRRHSRRRKNPSRRRSSRRSRRSSSRRRSSRRRSSRKSSRRSRRSSGRRRSSRRRSSRRSGGRRRSTRRRSSRRRGSRSLFGTITGSARSLTRPSSLKAGVVGGLQIGLGFAGVNALRALEGRFGLDSVLSRLPGGIASKVVEYGLKFVNTAVATFIGSKIGRGFGAKVQAGGMANIGVNLLADVAGAAGGPGEAVKNYLHGVGNYNLAYNMGQAMPGLNGMGNYNLAAGGQAMYSSSGEDVYPAFEDVY